MLQKGRNSNLGVVVSPWIQIEMNLASSASYSIRKLPRIAVIQSAADLEPDRLTK